MIAVLSLGMLVGALAAIGALATGQAWWVAFALYSAAGVVSALAGAVWAVRPRQPDTHADGRVDAAADALCSTGRG